MTAPRRPGQRGFTLIEVMIAMAILGLMMVVAWGTTRSTVDAKRHYEKVQERYREVRVAQLRIVHDLSMAYLSGNEDTTIMEKRTFFVGETSSSIDTLRFSTLAHTPLYADANESDQTVISYYAASDPVDRSQQNLIRRETRRLANEKWDTLPGEADVVFAGITKFKLEYWNARDREWEDAWDSTAPDSNLGKIPDRVRVSISFKDERDQEVTFTTQVRVHMQETLQFYAN